MKGMFNWCLSSPEFKRMMKKKKAEEHRALIKLRKRFYFAKSI